MANTIQLKRQELYEEVWTTPLTQLAKKYRISDVGLAKICKKLKIPVPGRGYWARKGKMKKQPLPSIKGVPEFAVHKIVPDSPALETSENEEIQALIAFDAYSGLFRPVSPFYPSH
jgi:hypothetical protein